MTQNLSNTIGNFEHDNLFANGVMPVVTNTITVQSGASYLRGTVLGIVTATGEATIVDSTAADGSEKPYAILADDVDATEATAVSVAYFTGEFNEAALIFGGTDTTVTHEVALREIGIFLKKTVKA
jgi:hypothetical protein